MLVSCALPAQNYYTGRTSDATKPSALLREHGFTWTEKRIPGLAEVDHLEAAGTTIHGLLARNREIYQPLLF